MILKLWLLKIQVHLTMIQGQLNSRNFDPLRKRPFNDVPKFCWGHNLLFFRPWTTFWSHPHTPTHPHTHTHQEHEVSVAGSSALGDVGHVDLVQEWLVDPHSKVPLSTQH